MPNRRTSCSAHPAADGAVSWRKWAVGALVALSLCACERDTPEYVLSGATMGTSYTVRIVAPPPEFSPDETAARVQRALDDIEARMSTWLPDSEVSRFNAAAAGAWFPVSADTLGLVMTAAEVGRMSDGAFDITAGPLVDLWGFGPAAGRAAPPADVAVAEARARVGFDRLQTRDAPPALRKSADALAIDLSALAKGHAVDRVAALLEGAGVADYLVEIGGEIRVGGRNRRGGRWQVAVEDPRARNGRGVNRVLSVTDTAVATSGDYRNFFRHDGARYSHAIDPRSGRPVSHDLVSVTVLAPNAALADALATALLVLGPGAAEDLADRADIAAYFLSRGGGGLIASWSPAFAEADVM